MAGIVVRRIRPTPAGLRRLHGALVITWALLWVVAAIFGWLASVVFVSHLSMASLVLGSASAWQAARGEMRADPASPNP